MPLFYSLVDCKDHIENMRCFQNDCSDRHRQKCKYFNSIKGCNNKVCLYLHTNNKGYPGESEQVQELDKKIIKMKTDLIDKDSEINLNIKVINDLKEDLKQMEKDLDSKEREIVEKDKIINIIENTHKNSDTEDEDYDD